MLIKKGVKLKKFTCFCARKEKIFFSDFLLISAFCHPHPPTLSENVSNWPPHPPTYLFADVLLEWSLNRNKLFLCKMHCQFAQAVHICSIRSSYSNFPLQCIKSFEDTNPALAANNTVVLHPKSF